LRSYGVNPDSSRQERKVNDTPRLFRIIIQVDDLAPAVKFYSSLLGTTGRAVRGARHYFDCGPVILALLDPTQEGSEARPLPDFIYFAVDDLEAVYARAADMGCLSKDTIHGRDPAGVIAKRPWGERSFYAVDPFGNGLCFVDADTVFTGDTQSTPSTGTPIVKLDDLLMAFEFVSAGMPAENEAYMCRETGAIILA
jgi:predicted enzyme related to lactoylglutathione lyase